MMITLVMKAQLGQEREIKVDLEPGKVYHFFSGQDVQEANVVLFFWGIELFDFNH